MANELNKNYVNVEPTVAAKILRLQSFESHTRKTDSQMNENPLLIDEIKEVFFSWKMNKKARFDEISFNVVRKVLW